MGASSAAARVSYPSASVNYTPSFMPSFALVGDVAPGWRLLQPLTINLEVDTDGSYLVSDDDFNVYGVGESKAGAVRDYVNALCEYYDLLAANTGAESQSLLGRLRHFLIPLR